MYFMQMFSEKYVCNSVDIPSSRSLPKIWNSHKILTLYFSFLIGCCTFLLLRARVRVCALYEVKLVDVWR